ncbi:MAG: LuxR C-terminal-related transcriptional regulator [Nocardioides sp.]
MSLNPGRRHTAVSMRASRPLNAAALARGVAIRAVYQNSARTDPATMEYARWFNEAGGEVRTAPTVPVLMVVVDAEVALLPWAPERPAQGAVEVRVPAIVAALMEYFEQMWRLADPLGTARHREAAVHSAVVREVVRLASGGLTDEAVARRLEVSPRTVRRIMAEVMSELGAASRFQAGVEAARRGWLD